MTVPTPSGALEVHGSRWMRWAWIPAALVLLALVIWWVLHPQELPTGDEDLSVTTPAGRTVYVGVLGADPEGSRSLSIRDVVLEFDGDEVDVEARICKGGSIGQTSAPERFCDDVPAAEGNTLRLGGGDQLIVAVTAEGSQTIEIERPRVSYREGVQFATQQAGRPIVVEVIGGGTP